MARSLSANFSVTGVQIVNDALRCIGAISQGENPTGTEVTDGRRALNMMMKTWMGGQNEFAPGIKMWQRGQSAIDPSSAKISYTIAPASADLTLVVPVAIPAMNAKDSDGNETKLEPMTLEEYFKISNKTNTGIPSKFCYERGYDIGTVYFDLFLSDDTYTFPFVYLREIYEIDDADDDIDFPVHWYEALKYHLAIRLAPEYGKVVSQDLKDLANLTLAQAQTFYPEETPYEDLYFQPGKD